jgi:hypothetical protein
MKDFSPVARFWVTATCLAAVLTVLPFGSVSSLTGTYWTFGRPLHVCQIKVGYSDRGDISTTLRLVSWYWGSVVENAAMWSMLAFVVLVAVKWMSRRCDNEKSQWALASYVLGAIALCVLMVNDLQCWGTWACFAFFLLGANQRNQMLSQTVGACVVVPLLALIIALRLVRLMSSPPAKRIGILMACLLGLFAFLCLAANCLARRLAPW